jgi:hypothetical protein
MPNSTPTEQIAEQARNIPKAELRAILLQRILDFDTSISNFYPGSGFNGLGPVLKEYADLRDRYFQSGGTLEELAHTSRLREQAAKQTQREKVRALIAVGKFPAVPPCPQYFKNDTGCNWETEWFDYHIRVTLQKNEQQGVAS